MAEFPALQLWTDAYLGDTAHLTTIEHGAYLLLLMTAWRTSDCSLPDDDKMLARYCRMTAAQWARIKPLMLTFWQVQNGRWRQRRLTDEYNAVRQKREAAAINGKLSALKRKGRHATERERSDNGASTTTATATATATIAKAIGVPPERLRVVEPSEFDAFWAAYPLRKGKEAARKAWASAGKRNVPAAKIIAAAKWFAEHPPDDAKYIPHPATWLNQGRYDDEPIERTCNVRNMGRNNGQAGSRAGAIADVIAAYSA